MGSPGSRGPECSLVEWSSPQGKRDLETLGAGGRDLKEKACGLLEGGFPLRRPRGYSYS
jgi:hypothetical protein